MDLQRMLHLTFIGPSDYGDPYYSYRLQIDELSAGNLEVTGSWRENYLPFYSSQVDVPIFALAGDLLSGSGTYETYRDLIAPVRGQSKPRTEVGFRIHNQPNWGHIDVLLIAPDRNPFYIDFLNWTDEWMEGTVQVPEFGP